MPAPFRLIWSDAALRYLEQLHERAPGQAEAVVNAMEWMADSGFSLGAEVRPGRHYWPVPPQGVYYAERRTALYVESILDVRRRHTRRP
ncbi:MAG: hypothetical protein JF887_00465 [Candidatus Dormibacteraeota bacterium]|uniref:Uncharacterized protein n=1 Tax=Candidatus Amunia macphersoniae TaxID=3127014 RepID=A0A934KML1_9BACT|nr:hypothetical protein [Candidatus Dormibacteraeota bacterium]